MEVQDFHCSRARATQSPAQALEANWRLVEFLTGRRWSVMQEAREAGDSWTVISDALGVTKQGALDWYTRKVADQEKYAGKFHDATRARAVLDGDGEGPARTPYPGCNWMREVGDIAEMEDIEWQQDIHDGVRCEVGTVGLNFASALADIPVTVHMPGPPIQPGALYLTQPSAILGRSELQPGAWGFWPPEQTEIVVINRMGLTAMVADTQVVGDEMNAWVELFLSWLDLLTGQHLTTVGYRPPQQAADRTCLRIRDSDGSLLPEWVVRPFPPLYRLSQVKATEEMLKRSCALAGDKQQVPLAWELLRDARALHRVTQTRRAAIECASAAEMSIKALLDRRNVTPSRPRPTLGPLSGDLRGDGYPLPTDFDDAFVEVRNREVHMKTGWGYVSEAESRRMLEIATALVEEAFPFPYGMKRAW